MNIAPEASCSHKEKKFRIKTKCTNEDNNEGCCWNHYIIPCTIGAHLASTGYVAPSIMKVMFGSVLPFLKSEIPPKVHGRFGLQICLFGGPKMPPARSWRVELPTYAPRCDCRLGGSLNDLFNHLEKTDSPTQQRSSNVLGNVLAKGQDPRREWRI